MKTSVVGTTAIAMCAAAVVIAASQTGAPAASIKAVPLAQVKVTGGFWLPKMETNRAVSIPHIFKENETTGRVDNFRKGAKAMPGDYAGRRFNDTDIYKAIEAASYTLVSHPDPALAKQIDALIALIVKCQEPDGYLFPARTINPSNPAAGIGTERWMYENTGSHELYNSGHLYEAAVAHFQATGKRTLFDVALKNADLVVKTFGPTARHDAPGHEIVEMALVRLSDAAGKPAYLNEAKFFVDQRGKPHDSQDYPPGNFAMYNDRPYRQDQAPVIEQTRAVGHAVRAVYLYSAVADLARLFKDPAYNKAIDGIWQDVASKRMYITGGLGARGTVEAFGDDYELPNRSAYTETCASVGGILWHQRMFLKSGDAKYLDAFEQTLYNGLLSGVSVAGDTFFYQNPLESAGGARSPQRSEYFDVACCPANLARLIAELPSLVYAQQNNTVFVNLFVNSDADVTLPGGPVHLKQTTNYPWDGDISLTVSASKATKVTLKVRAPGWMSGAPIASDLYTFAPTASTPSGAALATGLSPISAPVNGWFTFNVTVPAGGAGITQRLSLPMPVRRVLAHAGIKDDVGKAAIQRGPLVYALEGVDNDGKVLNVSVPLDAAFSSSFHADLLGGVTTLSAKGIATNDDTTTTPKTVTAVPYFAWANRGRGEMAVWVRY